MQKTLAIDDLQIGMYVKDVICKNTDTKVKTQGVVKSRNIIKQLIKQGVVEVIIEVDDPVVEEPVEEVIADAEANKPATTESRTKPRTLEQEFAKSCQVYDAASGQIKQLFGDVAGGQPINKAAVDELAAEITDSVSRNEYAMSMLTRIRNQSTYLWEHTVNTAVLMCGFALYLGIDREQVQQITVGALLHDVGTAKIPSGILSKNGKLTKSERQAVNKHVAWGYDICKRDKIIDKVIIDMVVNHHERIDGSGYPRALTADKLSTLAKMIAIVDVYDAMTGDKHYKPGDQPINALRYLLGKREKFDQGLVQKFIKYMGVHPVGSLVKMSNEKLAVVIQGNREQPLQPIVKTFYSLKHKHYLTAAQNDLSSSGDTILASVRPEDYGINISRIIREMLF